MTSKLDVHFSQDLGDLNRSVYRKGQPYKRNGGQGMLSGGQVLEKSVQVE